MAIRGSLDTFSLPELFQIIESGSKSGKLSFNPQSKNDSAKTAGMFELWFESGNFVAVVNSSSNQSLIANLQNIDGIDLEALIKAKYSCPKNLPFGTHLQQQGLLTTAQINTLFKNQIDAVKQLFYIDRAQFQFEEIDRSQGNVESFPCKEMTGNKKRPAELSIEAMRDFSNWQRFEDELPPATSGIQKLDSEHNLQLTSLEENIWKNADGTVALKDIARQTSTSLTEVQKTAFSMIISGIVEEVPVAGFKNSAATLRSSQSALLNDRNVAVKPAVKTKVSNSLINNLVGFLRNNF